MTWERVDERGLFTFPLSLCQIICAPTMGRPARGSALQPASEAAKGVTMQMKTQVQAGNGDQGTPEITPITEPIG